MILSKKYILLLIMISLLIPSYIFASETIDISKADQQSILFQSDIYFANQDLSLQEVIDKNLFAPYNKESIYLGMSDKKIWVRVKLSNKSKEPVRKIIVINSPLIEHIAFYKEKGIKSPEFKGMAHIMAHQHNTLSPYFEIDIPPMQEHTYYLSLSSSFTSMNFALTLHSKDNYVQEDHIEQLIDILLVGMVLALAMYSLMLFFYVKDKSYFYYGMYLVALLYQQSTYLGLTQVYAPTAFILFDMQIVVFKINILIISSAFFAVSFLKLKKDTLLYNIYKWFIYITLMEIVIMSMPAFFNLTVVILTGTLFITFNLIAGIITYRQGYKQARLFILGFGVVFASYMFMIVNALGFSTLLLNFRNILMFSTAFEALILSLAFADRYLILQKSKAQLDKQILEEFRYREQIIKKTVDIKTKKLNATLAQKDLLLREIHHRVKNNLQIILSMVRMQNDTSLDKNTQLALESLEHRINAISKTYSMLLTSDDVQMIDMKLYINELIEDLQASLALNERSNIHIVSNIHAKLTLKTAVYIGLIINELVTNAYKHAFPNGKGTITINLKQGIKEHILEIYDNGIGYNPTGSKNSFGLKLINILIKHQLKGTLITITQPHCKYIIRFST